MADAFIVLINECISDCWFSLIINGDLNGFFSSSKGVRQGDPLSSASFIIAEELLAKSFLDLATNDSDMAYHIPNGKTLPCLLFVDDCIFFCKGKQETVHKLMDILSEYEESTGQKVNRSKSCYISSSQVSSNFNSMMHNSTNFFKSELPMTYLGAPKDKKLVSKTYFFPLI